MFQQASKRISTARQRGSISGGAIGTIVLIVLGLIMVFFMVTTVDARKIVVKQSISNGELTVWSTPGPKMQNFGTLTEYARSIQYSFSAASDQGDKTDQSIKVRFNDGGHGNISGTMQFDFPTDQRMAELHKIYGSTAAIQTKLLRPAVERAVYMSGPLMSSKESSAERRSDLLRFVEDQIMYGVYRTRTVEVKDIDPISGKERTVKHVDLIENPKAPSGYERQEESALARFGIRGHSFNINGIVYDNDVENQIKEQQRLAMQIQTSIANAREAEQRAKTVEENGKADAAAAKWKQEVEKAKAVTLAEQEKAVAVTKGEQEKAVAELAKQAAEFTKQAETLVGEGEAKRAELMMRANGMLEKKLDVYEKVMLEFASQMGKQQWVPTYYVSNGGNGGSGASAASEYIQLMGMQAAKGLNLNMSMAK